MRFRIKVLPKTALLIAMLVAGLRLSGVPQQLSQEEYVNISREFEILQQQLRKNPADVPTLNSIGILYARSGRVNDAIEIWRHAMRIDHSYIHLYNNLGSALKSVRRYEEAIIIYRTGLSISQSFWIHYNLGLLQLELGRHLDAVKSFQAALTLNPEFEPAISRLQDMGYAISNAPTSHQRTYSLGFKPPVETGNIDLMSIFPTESGAMFQPKARPSSPWKEEATAPSAPVTLRECLERIQSFDPPPEKKFVALTFDDGPHAQLTVELLDLLRREGARATFFVLGKRAEMYPSIIARMVREGHDVGNHTWDHKSLVSRSRDDAVADLKKTADLLSMLTGKPTRIVRPPYGHTSSKVQELIHAKGWHHVMWDVDSRDWQLRDHNQMLRRVLRGFFPGSIILFHDIHPGSLKLLPMLITALKNCGYRFLTISQMTEILDIAG